VAPGVDIGVHPVGAIGPYPRSKGLAEDRVLAANRDGRME
jgi:hypothetical protein